MTRSKLEFATILASLRGDGSDPQKLAQEMNLRKLCYEIEKIEAEREAAAAAAVKEVEDQAPPKGEEDQAPPPKQKRGARVKPFWAFLTLESSDED